MRALLKNEVTFTTTPIGIKYICEFCNEGEMMCVENNVREDNLFTHKCTKCEKTMLLPRVYPYIEWEVKEEE